MGGISGGMNCPAAPIAPPPGGPGGCAPNCGMPTLASWAAIRACRSAALRALSTLSAMRDWGCGAAAGAGAGADGVADCRINGLLEYS